MTFTSADLLKFGSTKPEKPCGLPLSNLLARPVGHIGATPGKPAFCGDQRVQTPVGVLQHPFPSASATARAQKSPPAAPRAGAAQHALSRRVDAAARTDRKPDR